MKFVALALALLLAVGSQAASLQADAPSQLEHFRAALDVYLTQIKDSANRALDRLDGTEYADLKATASQRVDAMYNNIKALQAGVSPMTDSVITTVGDATADLRSSLMNDLDALKTQYESVRPTLKDTISKHLDEYRTLLEPIITENYKNCAAQMEALTAKAEPAVEELRTKVATNIEETKNVLRPVVDNMSAMLTERLENLKQMVAPYVEEYKDQFKQAYNQAQNINTDELTALRAKITPLAEDIKAKFEAIGAALAETVTKS